jgi:hypothetical protein
MARFGSWLFRKNEQCVARKSQAKENLRNCGYDADYLREQWAEQVKVQTRPLPRTLFHF